MLADLVAQELGLLQSFIALLRQEQSLLAEGEADRVASLIEEKSALAIRLGTLADARESDLAARGLPAGRPGMDLWIASPEGASSRRRWEQLLVQAAEAKMLNETNGKLISLQLQHNQQALDVLMAAANQAATYGPDGQQKNAGSGRSLGSA
jgi:flagella synthesis protein FlgN